MRPTLFKVLGRTKIWTIAYADDVVLSGNNEKRMKYMLERFKRYSNMKRLELNVDMSKENLNETAEK